MKSKTKQTASFSSILLLGLTSALLAQPPSPEMINTTIPDEEAVAPMTGAYATLSEKAFGNPGLLLQRPADLSAFPGSDSLPVVVWGNGGCAVDGSGFAGFLGTLASHGFLVITTTPLEGEGRRSQTDADLLGAIDWATAENSRAGSGLNGKIDLDSVAIFGQSCGGFLALGIGGDPRVDTVAAFNSGLQPAGTSSPPGRATADALIKLHGPVLFINGSERDFAMAVSRDNFDSISHVPAFYGARHGGGHLASFYHPGGGEFANVAASWLLYVLKDDAAAGRMFRGDNCTLCTNPDWDTAAKDLE